MPTHRLSVGLSSVKMFSTASTFTHFLRLFLAKSIVIYSTSKSRLSLYSLINCCRPYFLKLVKVFG
ncbi:unnamed protein product [Cunninghamella echinulata]